MHMALLGPEGLERLALRVAAATEATKKAICSIENVELVSSSMPNFREFAVKLPGPASDALLFMDEKGVLGGFDLGEWWESNSSCLLIGCDDRTSQSDIDALVEVLSSWIEVVCS
jgi:glycine dehydrogenase subunit 1